MAATVLTADQARQISDLPKSAGRLQLAKYLHWNVDEFDEEVDLTASIILDYHYDNLMTTIKKGFPWRDVCAVFQFAMELQAETIGLPITEAIKHYKNKVLELANVVGENNVKTFTQHFFSTFMQHYKLYQFVATQQQEQMITVHRLHVYPPPEPMPFIKGKEFAVWDYTQKVKDMEEKEQARNEEMTQHKRDLMSVKEEVLEGPYQGLDAEEPLERKELSQLIDEAAKAHIMFTQKTLETKVQERHDTLDFLFEKTALPRPAALGPPTRIKSPPKSSAKSQPSASSKKTEQAGSDESDEVMREEIETV
ncbi:uncharacterized protein C8orf74 homolog isoform X2 [Ptychodera flava]|uniref:uncharacterized protein C8orf74 homolog isoform X2 n=1 Tax=Ptychodera flava TaxID=63121 RepID=UPI00396A0357